jgi:glycosyltransferase involved in cell wall biosynthesis
MLIGFDASRAFGKENTGTENYSLNLLKALAKIDRKNHYRVYLRGFSGDKTPNLPNSPNLPDNFQLRPIYPNRLWTQIGLALETWRAPVDVLFVPAHTLPVLRNYRVKTVVTMHDLGVEYLPNYHKFPQRYYLDLASKYAAKSASRLIAVSQATKHDLEKRYGVDTKKISVVYEGVDRDFFKPQSKGEVEMVKRKYKISGEYFLYVGTVQPRKNLVFLIDIFNTFVKSNIVKVNNTKYNKTDRDLSLIIAGKMGWDYDEIVHKGNKKVRFLGYADREDLPALYSGANAAVFPSLFEGFGLPILEALSSGCRVIASDIPVHRELFHATTRGYRRSLSTNKQSFSMNINIKIDANDRKSTILSNPEPMALAKLNDERQWLGLLHQNSIDIYKNRLNRNKSFLADDDFTWEKVAKETLTVFNRVVQVKS